MAEAPLVLNPRACDRCGRCVSACPHDALRVGRTYLKVDPVRCDGCGACARVCARRAIVMKGQEKKSPKPRTEKRAEKRTESRATDATTAPRARKATGATKTASSAFAWTLLDALAVLSVTVAAFAVKETLAAGGMLPALSESLQAPVRVGLLVLYYAIQLLMLIWLVRRRAGDVATALGLRGGPGGARAVVVSVGLVVAGLVGVRVVSSLYTFATREFGVLPQTSTDLVDLFGSGVSGLVLAVAMVVIVGPVVEELVFRGALLRGLSSRLGMWPSVLIQAALFAALHRSLWLFAPMLVLGIVLGWLAESRQSLWPPIALHALYNAITVVAAFVVSRTG